MCTCKWSDTPIARKLSLLQDYEGKTRTIGIGDYWTQTVLVPLHRHLNGILAKIKEDCTFDHSSFKSKLPKVGPYYSFDLTNATDRLPLELQKTIIKWIVRSDERGDDWATLMSGLEFVHKDSQKSYKYETGQPMGLYSS